MEAPMRMRRDFEALDRSEAAAAMAEAKEWDRVAAEAAAGREKYRGVSKVPSGKYRALIQDPTTKEPLWLGTYKAPVVAACAYDLTARSLQLQGHRARPNFAYPPHPGLVSAVAATPRRRRHSYPAPPAPPAPAPASAPFGGRLSFQAPAASEPAPFRAYPYPHVPRAARARIVLPVPTTTTTSTDADCEFTGDNFTRVPFPWDLNL